MDMTCPFPWRWLCQCWLRVPLALPVFVTRRGHRDSALAEPVAHESRVRKLGTFIGAFYQTVGSKGLVKRMRARRNRHLREPLGEQPF